MITFGSLCCQFTYEWQVKITGQNFSTASAFGLLSSMLYVFACRSAGLYSLPSLLYPAKNLKRALAVCTLVFLCLTAVLFLLKFGPEFHRGALLVFAALMLVFCCVTRIGAALLIEALIRNGRVTGRPIFLIGEEDEVSALTDARLLRDFGVRETGRLLVSRDCELDPVELNARIVVAMAQARADQAREFIVLMNWNNAAALSCIGNALRSSPLPVRLIPHAAFRFVIEHGGAAFETGGYSVMLQRSPMGLEAQIAKRITDILGATVAIIVLMPIFVLAALAVKMDSAGPVIFRQRRNGFDRRQFVIFKFRTMRAQDDGSDIKQAQRNDNRITAVGRVLRRTSIDELPQLFNVLRGEMSLVGPRPHALAHDQEYSSLIGDYCIRHHVKPGITGWAQINGCRGETAIPEHMQRRVELDLWYIRNRSSLLDAHILLRTAIDVARHDAY